MGQTCRKNTYLAGIPNQGRKAGGWPDDTYIFYRNK